MSVSVRTVPVLKAINISHISTETHANSVMSVNMSESHLGAFNLPQKAENTGFSKAANKSATRSGTTSTRKWPTSQERRKINAEKSRAANIHWVIFCTDWGR